MAVDAVVARGNVVVALSAEFASPEQAATNTTKASKKLERFTTLPCRSGAQEAYQGNESVC